MEMLRFIFLISNFERCLSSKAMQIYKQIIKNQTLAGFF